MKLFYWNCRGFGNPDTRNVFRLLCLVNKPNMVFVSEPWIDIDNVPATFWSNLNMKHVARNDRNGFLPNLWCLCNVNLSPSVISRTSQ